MHKITLTNLSYSDALTYAKARNGGIRISREGWNGKGMYVIYFSPVANGLEMLKVLDNDQGGTTLPLRPFLLMKDATNCYVPWLASQTDMLETDWCIAEDEANLMNEVKQKGVELGDLFEKLEKIESLDKRWLAIGKTDLQKGLMATTRAIARPGFF